MLSRRVGVRHVEVVEDAVQSALMKALETWTVTGRPDNPSAWLFRVAHNGLIDELRREDGHRRILDRSAFDLSRSPGYGPVDGQLDDPTSVFEGEIRDDLLRMLFICCDDVIPMDSQLVFALKVLCGFSVPEIAARLFTSDANVYKRLARARTRLRAAPDPDTVLNDAGLATRTTAVNRILYVLFTEGHLSSRADVAIRRELCEEAIRLTTLLAKHPTGQAPETFALLALMHFNFARMRARVDPGGSLLLLEEQDRSSWDRKGIARGLHWLARSASGQTVSRYHVEAGIAVEHCRAATFATTRWDKVVEYYRLLASIAPSPIHELNGAIAMAEWQGPEAGLKALQGIVPPTWLEDSYLWPAALADLHRRCNHAEEATCYRDRALATAPSAAVRRLLQRRLGSGASDQATDS